MRARLTSAAWIETATTLAAAVLMTLAGVVATLNDAAQSPTVSVSTPVRVTDAIGPADASRIVAMPHVEIALG